MTTIGAPDRLLSFPWPRPPSAARDLFWTGHGFVVDGRHQQILEYHNAEGNWSHDLTLLHEREAGSKHPLDIVSRRLALQRIRRHSLVEHPVVLDVGSSSGFFVEEFKAGMPDATLICSDYLSEPLKRLALAHPDIPLLQFDACRCPLPDESLDVVTALNVLEHIGDDQAALRQMARVLKKGGLAYVEVPAHPILYGIYDKYLLHNRRYSMSDLIRKAEAAGFEIAESTHLGFTILPPYYFVKLLDRAHEHIPPERLQKRVESQIRTTRGSWLVRKLLELEFRIGEHVRYPTGIRCVVVLRKP